MERRKRRAFTPEFKAQAVELSEQMGSISKAAEKLGIREDSIRLWKRSLGRSKNPQFYQTPQEAMRILEENKALKKQISDLEKTNYILKKAAAFFSQDHLK